MNETPILKAFDVMHQECTAPRFHALFVSVPLFTILFVTTWYFGSNLWFEIPVWVCMTVALHTLAGSWLEGTTKRARLLEHTDWEVTAVEPWVLRTVDMPDMIMVQLTEIGLRLPLRREHIEIPRACALAQELTFGRQLRLHCDIRYPLTILPWETLYSVRPLWKRCSWKRTSFGNYVCKLEAWWQPGGYFATRSYPGDNIDEAYQGLVAGVLPRQLPPIEEFVMDNPDVLDPPEERAALRFMAGLGDQRDRQRENAPGGAE